MTFFSEANPDAQSVAPGAVAQGPLVGFLDSFRVSVDAQMRASSQYGIEFFMQDLDWQQTQAMLEAGVEDPPQLMLELEGSERGEGAKSGAQYLRKDSGYYEDFLPERSRAYLDVAKRYSGEEISPEFEERLQAYDARVIGLRKEFPDLQLRSSREMFEEVKRSAVAAEERDQTDRRTFGGAFGGFIGGAVSSLHPGTDPLNFYTLGVGGAGKTAVQRIAAQTGGQAVIETINQVTGVQEERRLLGLSNGVADAAMRVGMTAGGAGALQGVGELAGAALKAGRRYFGNTPDDPAPSPEVIQPDAPQLIEPRADTIKEEAQVARLEQDPRSYLDIVADEAPLSGFPSGRQRTAFDINDMTRQLEAWDSADPVATLPRTRNVTMPGETRPANVDVSAAVDNNRLYQAAKQQDPQTFSRFEKLTERRDTYRRWIEELSTKRNDDVQRTMEGMEQRMADLQSRLRTVQGKGNKAKVREQIREVQKDMDQLLRLSAAKESPDTAAVRKELMKVDEKMRDVAPLVGRAYSRARQSWDETNADIDAVWDAYLQGRTDVRPVAEPAPVLDPVMTLEDKAPILKSTIPHEKGETAADTARNIVAENQKVMDEALEAYRSELARLVDVSEDGKLTVQGTEYEFDIDKDKMFVPHEDGTGGREVSIREMLKENKRTEDELEAVSTCSIRKTS